MAITVHWSLDQKAKTYHLYRDTKRIDLNILPTGGITIPAADVVKQGEEGTYEYTDVLRQKIYYFVVCTEDNDGNKAYSENIILGYFPESGPGPTTLLRGNWEFGIFGEAPAIEVMSFIELKDAAAKYGKAWPNSGNTPTKWYKVIVGGRIIFIPDAVYSTTIYRWGDVAATFGTVLSAADSTYENDGIRVSKFGYEYIVRSPHMKLGEPTEYINISDPNWLKSEVGMINALHANTAVSEASNPAGNILRAHLHLNDGTPPVNANYVITTRRDASTTYMSYGAGDRIPTVASITEVQSVGQGVVWPVLELLF